MTRELLDELRRRIDLLDEGLVRLLNARSSCAREIGAIKRQLGLPVYQPEREREVLSHVRAVNPGPLDAGAITRLYERIIDEARRLERLAVAEAGGRDTIKHAAQDGLGADRREGERAPAGND